MCGRDDHDDTVSEVDHVKAMTSAKSTQERKTRRRGLNPLRCHTSPAQAVQATSVKTHSDATGGIIVDRARKERPVSHWSATSAEGCGSLETTH